MKYSKKTVFLSTLIAIIAIAILAFHFPKNRVFKSDEIKVIDGNTLELGEKIIKLKGIAAPHSDQECEVMVNGALDHYPCGKFASVRLSKIIDKKKVVECTDEGKTSEGKQLSYCFVDDVNLSRQMLKEGFAYADNNYDLFFKIEEMLARNNKRGLWHSKFERPSEWEKSHPKVINNEVPKAVKINKNLEKVTNSEESNNITEGTLEQEDLENHNN